MAFRFRFQPLLKKRRYELKLAQLDLSRARQSLDEALHAEQSVRGMLQEQHKRWLKEQAEGTTVVEHLMARDYIRHLERELSERTALSAQKAEELQECKALLLECEKKVKALEFLEEKDFEAFRYAAGRREQKRLDEMAILRQKNEVRQ